MYAVFSYTAIAYLGDEKEDADEVFEALGASKKAFVTVSSLEDLATQFDDHRKLKPFKAADSSSTAEEEGVDDSEFIRLLNELTDDEKVKKVVDDVKDLASDILGRVCRMKFIHAGLSAAKDTLGKNCKSK